MTQQTVDETLRGEIRQAVLEWVREALEDPSVELNENFLDVGGHSLAATRVNKQLEERYGLKMSIQTLFEATVAEACDQAEPVSS